jgi:hypothetical protein
MYYIYIHNLLFAYFLNNIGIYYFYGHKGLRYKPYKDIKGHDLFAKSDKTLMCKAKKVIFKIIECAGLNSPVDVNNLSSAAADKVFQDGLMYIFIFWNSLLHE